MTDIIIFLLVAALMLVWIAAGLGLAVDNYWNAKHDKLLFERLEKVLNGERDSE